MSNVIIQVDGVSKQYRLGQVGRRTIKHDVNRWWYLLQGKEDPYLKIGEENERTARGGSEYIWALEDINFDVRQGEVLGIIGRNGAGKSTLLKILSKVTAPTKGQIKIKGRIASLLEVGTGFHPDLTGRDNIFLNGAILGMTKKEIQNKFDEIVQFSGVERYIDTPVKRYSSGMYVRLAFAVAAHLEPDILIVDEVLAVGDTEFQKKCLGKMKDVSVNDGRTVLFVSHNIGVINQLCNVAIVLENGRNKFKGICNYATDYYLQQFSTKAVSKLERETVSETKNQFVSVYNSDENLELKQEFKIESEINLIVELNLPNWSPALELAVSLYDKLKRRIFTIHEPLLRFYDNNPRLKFKITIPANYLTPGKYSWLMCINHQGVELTDLQDDICSFTVLDTGSAFSLYSDYGSVFANYDIKMIV